MSGKKKSQKTTMSLSDFLRDDTTGAVSWADDVEIPTESSARFEDSSRPSYGNSTIPSSPYGDRSFLPRDPVDFPTEPPYSARVSNLSWDTDEQGLAECFAVKVDNVRIVRDPQGMHKGWGFVDFDDLDSLKAAKEMGTKQLDGRSIRIDIAERKARREDRTDVQSWRRTGPMPTNSRFDGRSDGRSDSGSWRNERSPRSGGFDREGGFNRNREYDTSWGSGRGGFNRQETSERPRLNLKPRTVGDADNKPSASTTSSKNDPFGGAKPVTTKF